MSAKHSSFNPCLQNVENRSINHFYSGFNNWDLEIALTCQMVVTVHCGRFLPTLWAARFPLVLNDANLLCHNDMGQYWELFCPRYQFQNGFPLHFSSVYIFAFSGNKIDSPGSPPLGRGLMFLTNIKLSFLYYWDKLGLIFTKVKRILKRLPLIGWCYMWIHLHSSSYNTGSVPVSCCRIIILAFVL